VQLQTDLCSIAEDENEEQCPSAEAEPSFVPQSVDSLHVEESIKAKVIGGRIRRLRLKRSMGLVELGKHTGLSASFLSQLETGRVIPTLRNLSRIALVFGKDLSHFFYEDKKNQFKKSRAKDRVRLPLGDKSSPILISESMGALIPDRSLVPCIADFLPVANNSSFEPSTFQGQELVYVLSGSLNITTENDRQKLEADDLAWIDGQLKRKYFCSPGKPARAMIISCPRKN
jgi:transcriptional regulator with XRE-family HTH domain